MRSQHTPPLEAFMNSLRRAALALLLFPPVAVAQVQQSGSAIPPGTLALGNLPSGARDAVFASIDARQVWNWAGAYDQSNKALMIDSTFGLARLLRVDLSGAPTAALANAEYRRAAVDASGRAIGEGTYLSGLRATGVNSNRLLGIAREMLPNDRRIALDHALSFLANERLDSLRSLVRQFPDFVAPRIWLAYYLTISAYSASPPQTYEALLVAESAVRLAPQIPGTHTVLGWVLFRQGRIDEATAHLAAATRMDPMFENAFSIESEVFVHDGKPRGVDRARAAYDSAITASPNLLRKINYRRDKAFMLFYDGRKAEGMTELAAVAKEYEAGAPATAATTYSQMAELAGGTGGDSATIAGYMAEARRVSPNTDLSVQAIQAYALAKVPGAARRELTEWVRRVPTVASDTAGPGTKSNYRRSNGMVLIAEGKYAEGIAEIKRSDIPSNPFAELSMVDAYNAMNNKAQANAMLAAILSRPYGPNTAISVAVAYYRAATAGKKK
jgi:tetratricopeptide (TPR) repeat protein